MPARAMWKGLVRFADLFVPVKLYAAVEDITVRFHLLHDEDRVRLKQRMINPRTGAEVQATNARKGYPIEPGRFVLVRDEELAALEPEPSRDVAIDAFVDRHRLPQQLYDRPYYLGPDTAAEHKYQALVEAIRQEGKVGIAHWTMRKKRYHGALDVTGDHLLLTTLHAGDEVIFADQLDAPGGRRLDAREVKMAQQLVGALHDRFDPSAFHNEYVARVRELVERKAAGQSIKLPRPPAARPEAPSLEAALEASLKQARSARRRKPAA